MKFTPQAISDVVLIQPRIYTDERGYFAEVFRQDLFRQAIGYSVNFVQDNESQSGKGVLRGLHYQLAPYAQSKLVRVVKGSVLDVAVDIRSNSPTFGQYVSAELSAENQQQLFVPKGFAHGFVVLSEVAIFAYKVDNYYAPKFDKGIAFDDKQLNIDWRLPNASLIVSAKDRQHPTLKNASK